MDTRRRCDGYKDCDGGEDEATCLEHTCQYWQIQCVTDGVCVHRGYVCDGENQCEDGTDEADCDKETITLPSGLIVTNETIHSTDVCTHQQFMCKDETQKCIPKNQV